MRSRPSPTSANWMPHIIDDEACDTRCAGRNLLSMLWIEFDEIDERLKRGVEQTGSFAAIDANARYPVTIRTTGFPQASGLVPIEPSASAVPAAEGTRRDTAPPAMLIHPGSRLASRDHPGDPLFTVGLHNSGISDCPHHPEHSPIPTRSSRGKRRIPPRVVKCRRAAGFVRQKSI